MRASIIASGSTFQQNQSPGEPGGGSGGPSDEGRAGMSARWEGLAGGRIRERQGGRGEEARQETLGRLLLRRQIRGACDGGHWEEGLRAPGTLSIFSRKGLAFCWGDRVFFRDPRPSREQSTGWRTGKSIIQHELYMI